MAVVPQVKYWIRRMIVALLLTGAATSVLAQESTGPHDAIANLFVGLLIRDQVAPDVLLERIDSNWHPGMLPMALETLRFARLSSVTKGLVDIVQKHTGQKFGQDINGWLRWMWKQPENRHPAYATFKSVLYRNIDPKFEKYFNADRKTTVRLDEIRWGGVKQDGIPPLRYPTMISAEDADYLSDDDVVFALKYGNAARAYPKRILAWHEMFIDRIEGVEYAGVYCTLCGAVIMYKTVHNGIHHAMGTSGFLYRSNKVMYDQATQSLWNTTFGEPVSGPLTGKGIALERSYIVTTTWGEWRSRHPQTTVLSLETGYSRNYDEGVAYREYFATDKLMFAVPEEDDRLANKAEILALQFPEKGTETSALSADFLGANPVFHHSVGAQRVVVLTDTSGANRVYDADGIEFISYDGDSSAADSTGKTWSLTEAALVAPNGNVRKRLPAHRAFWFGWVAVHPDTELVK